MTWWLHYLFTCNFLSFQINWCACYSFNYYSHTITLLGSIKILSFPAVHPFLCNNNCSTKSWPLHTWRLQGCHIEHKPWIYNRCVCKTWWRLSLLFWRGPLDKKSKFYVLKASNKISLHLKEPDHMINANYPDDIIHPHFVQSKCSFKYLHVDLRRNIKVIM